MPNYRSVSALTIRSRSAIRLSSELTVLPTCGQRSGYSLHVSDDPLDFGTKPIELLICRKPFPVLILHGFLQNANIPAMTRLSAVPCSRRPCGLSPLFFV